MSLCHRDLLNRKQIMLIGFRRSASLTRLAGRV